MGYFSNGAEGEMYERDVCSKCAHHNDGACPVLELHMSYNYDQFPEHAKPEMKHEAQTVKRMLDALIPRKKDTCWNDVCAMFHIVAVSPMVGILEIPSGGTMR